MFSRSDTDPETVKALRAEGNTPDASDAAKEPAHDPSEGEDLSAAPPLKPFSRKGAHQPSRPVAQPRPLAQPYAPEIPRRAVEIPGGPRRMQDSGDGKRLVVGKDIQLSGEISSCERLIVEGKVECNLSEAGAIEVARTGLFKGSANVDDAEISGVFEGTLTVRRRLILRSSGRIEGDVRYAQIEIEPGGRIEGTVKVLDADA